MTDTAWKIVATQQNFARDVLDASVQQPVLVDFWAPWCGPCRTLMPMLDGIADDYGGRFTLAKVNTDEEAGIAGEYGIRSIPTVMLFRDRQVVEQLVGVQPEATIRAMIDRQLDAATGEPDAATALLDAAATALERRDVEASTAALDQLEASAAEHPALPLLRARLAFVEAANASPDVAGLRTRLESDPGDAAARHALAAHYALAGDYATALAGWLELMRRDRRYGDELGRRSLLQAFTVLGEGHELVQATRRRMASLLH